MKTREILQAYENAPNQMELVKAVNFQIREHRLTLLEKRQLFEDAQRLENRLQGLTNQLVDLKIKYNALLKSKASCDLERSRILRKYKKLRQVKFSSIKVEQPIKSCKIIGDCTDKTEFGVNENAAELLKPSMQGLYLNCGPLSGVVCHPKAGFACCVSKNGNLSFINVDEEREMISIGLPKLKLSSVAISSDGVMLAISSLSGKILLGNYDQIENAQCLHEVSLGVRRLPQSGAILCLDWHCAGGVNCVKFLPNGHQLLTASSDGSILLWDVRSKRQERRFLKHVAPVKWVDFSRSGTHFSSCDSDGVVVQWDIQGYQPSVMVANQMACGHGRNCIVHSPDDKYWFAGNTNGSISAISAATHEVLTSIGHRASVTALGFDSLGKRLISVAEDGCLRIWNYIKNI
uniref:WD_REPEATS_REGION domain-containing protein n=1 Tax=Mesocestoides corti TaxID=53468 RepID=A0A5K3FEI3_MESCO